MARAQNGITLAPDNRAEYREAILRGGGELVSLGPDTRALIWSRHGGPDELRATVGLLPNLEWVQLPSAGVDNFFNAGVLRDNISWTSAKGSYSRPVAEHALALTLALLRQLQVRARARRWGEPAGASLFGRRVLILGAGGIAEEFARLAAPFEVTITVCRRHPAPVSYADQTVGWDGFAQQLPLADVVVLAAPLTDETRRIIAESTLGLMLPSAVLVNVARGGLIDTTDLVRALAAGRIAGAGLDVTDPEPLPDGHPLWSEPLALITPHSADTDAMIAPLLAQRIEANVSRFLRGEPLEGGVDLAAGY